MTDDHDSAIGDRPGHHAAGAPAPAFLDGNALAGPLSTVFAVDVTVAFLVCAGCGRRDRMAGLRVYDAGLGLVARCSGCDHVVLRYTSTPTGTWLDLRGAVTLQIPAPGSSPA
jgi:hypothetical protein